MCEWLFLGSSPNGPHYLPIAAKRHPRAKTITCNAGILQLMPTYYFGIQQAEAERYHTIASQLRDSCGTVCYTLQRHSVPGFLEISDRPGERPLHGQYGQFRYSGPFCVQIALMHGATRVILVGCEGYKQRQPNYFNENDRGDELNKFRSSCNVWAINRDVFGEQFTAICQAWPEVEFSCYGPTQYTVRASNWTYVDV